ncbi:hypothetical protein LJC01_02240 [Clostridiaceae bacterium OttesenSCG-928-D20]|nr:hypothetical protein [Clostridiaceae bacterium OttesenSCG-928-D20]
MDGYVITYQGESYKLPVVLSWDIKHGMGSPCDAFEITVPYDFSMQKTLEDAVRFRGDYQGKTVFFGVVDEVEIFADKKGSRATIRGRSLAALLLDNEAEAAEYSFASPDFIINRHIRPWGIEKIQLGEAKALPFYTIAAGASSFRVIEDYFYFAGGIRPRFSREGVLILDNSDGDEFELDMKTAMSSLRYKITRYGVISSVLVKNKVLGINSLVEDAEFKARGGKCHRVLGVPRNKNAQTMRHTGEYQIKRSKEGAVTLELSLIELFAAFPADIIHLKNSPIGLSGKFRVIEARCRADAQSATTRLVLEPIA